MSEVIYNATLGYVQYLYKVYRLRGQNGIYFLLVDQHLFYLPMNKMEPGEVTRLEERDTT